MKACPRSPTPAVASPPLPRPPARGRPPEGGRRARRTCWTPAGRAAGCPRGERSAPPGSAHEETIPRGWPSCHASRRSRRETSHPSRPPRLYRPPHAPRRLPRETALRPRRRTSPLEGPETPRLSSWRHPRRERTRAHPGATSPRWSSLFRLVRVDGDARCEDIVVWRGQSCVRAAFAADLRVGTPVVVRGILGRSRGRRKRETQARDARSRRRRVGTADTLTHPKAPRPRASTATGAAPCRLASRPSGAAALELPTCNSWFQTSDLISKSRTRAHFPKAFAFCLGASREARHSSLSRR